MPTAPLMVPTAIFLRRTLTEDLTVPSGFTYLAHELEIEDGVELTIEDGAEVLYI